MSPGRRVTAECAAFFRPTRAGVNGRTDAIVTVNRGDFAPVPSASPFSQKSMGFAALQPILRYYFYSIDGLRFAQPILRYCPCLLM
jgi:hypothetical protein